MKQLRSLASVITSRGATLYDLLRREVDLRVSDISDKCCGSFASDDIRTNIINRQLELTEVETDLQNSIKMVENEGKEFQNSIENVGSDESNLEAKIEKKKTALERGQKRLLTLKKVRPAFMDEYEKLEEDLKRHYDDFTKRFMNLAFLEHLLEEQDRMDNERRAEREVASSHVYLFTKLVIFFCNCFCA
ncbi:Clusterin-associated protein 1 [Armadillidium vulgare]|nr:Clusterin-associated protein 1 [Armadillidium vulgare]